MTTGIIILGIVAVLLFFGVAERYFDRLGMTSWLTFLIVLALIIGAVMPEVRTGNFVMTIGGFAVPAVVFVLLTVFAAREGNILRTLLALTAQAAVCVALRAVIGTDETGAVTAFFLLAGFIGGSISYAIAGTRLGAAAAIFGGGIIGDIISMGLIRSMNGQGVFTMGGYGIFNAMIIGCATALIFAEIVYAVRRSIRNKRLAERRLSAEAAEDAGLSYATSEHVTADGSAEEDADDLYGGD